MFNLHVNKKMKNLISALSALLICFFIFQTAMAQEQTKPAPPATATVAAAPTPPPTTPTANPADVSTLDGIVKAVYDVISGDAGTARNWDRFRGLFHKDARLIPTGKNQQTGKAGANALTPEDYIKRADPVLVKDGFHEIEIARRCETFGNIAHCFSSYSSKHKKTDEKPFMRGINSFQLMNDGTRWWVVTIYWQQESPDNPIPEKYLKSQN
jgi:hypothetical protein